MSATWKLGPRRASVKPRFLSSLYAVLEAVPEVKGVLVEVSMVTIGSPVTGWRASIHSRTPLGVFAVAPLACACSRVRGVGNEKSSAMGQAVYAAAQAQQQQASGSGSTSQGDSASDDSGDDDVVDAEIVDEDDNK